jgi:hypothetical protein
VDRRPPGNLRYELDVASEARHGEVDDRPHPQLVQTLQAADRCVDRNVRVPLRVGQVPLQLEIADEDVLMDEGDP